MLCSEWVPSEWEQAQTALKILMCDENMGWTFSSGGSVIMDSYFVQKWWFQVNDGFVSYKHAASQDIN